MLEIVNYIDFVIYVFVNICKEKIFLKKKKILWYIYMYMFLQYCVIRGLYVFVELYLYKQFKQFDMYVIILFISFKSVFIFQYYLKK